MITVSHPTFCCVGVGVVVEVGLGKIKIKDNLGQAKNQVKSVIGYKTK